MTSNLAIPGALHHPISDETLLPVRDPENFSFVMAGLRPGHPRLEPHADPRTWMPGTRLRRGFDGFGASPPKL